MEIFLDPTVWAGLLTLIVLEIVLGIDNLIFIAILSDKLPPHERQKARITGLSLALFMRLALLASISWMTTLTATLFVAFGFEISGRDLIMLVGGAFLLFKATMELHEKLEGAHNKKTGPINYANFWMVIVQIIILDAVFSLDSVITAVGMSDHLSVMMVAVCVAMVVMILASNKLMDFVSAHPTVVILCLGFLLMIGFSLMVEGLDYHIPKGYIYAAIGFSVLIEACNQLAQRNRRKTVAKIDPRTRVLHAVSSLLGSRSGHHGVQHELSAAGLNTDTDSIFKPQEKLMIQRVLQLAEQPVKAIMTPRNDLYWIDLADPREALEREIADCPYSCLIVAKNGGIDEPLGIILKKDLADLLLEKKGLEALSSIIRQPIVIPDIITVLQTMDMFQKSRIHVGIVVDEYGALEGLVTLTDVLESIAGDMPEDHEDDDFKYESLPGGAYLVNGNLSVQELSEILQIDHFPEGDYNTAAGIALNILRRMPHKGDHFQLSGWQVHVDALDGRRVSRLRFTRA
jgi:CBS domain containing-hemolysin-like protein